MRMNRQFTLVNIIFKTIMRVYVQTQSRSSV